MDDTQKWRTLLGSILHDPKERQRIANEMQLNPLTLTRWINGEATPRSQNLRLLLNALPQHRASLLESMPQAWKSAFDSAPPVDESFQEIPSAFFVRILNAYSSLSKGVRFNSIFEMIMQRMLKHLDPNRVGMEITLARCLPPSSGGKVHSLRETLGRGTPPWSDNIEQRAFLLGSESLAGYVVTSGRPVAIRSREDNQWTPVHWTPWEESAMAYPFIRDGRVAGCLLVSSTRPGYFSEERQAIVGQYTQLLAVALESDEFYDFGSIELYMMPSFDIQRPYFATFRERVNEVLREASRKGEFLSLAQAEELVWHQLEAELAQATS